MQAKDATGTSVLPVPRYLAGLARGAGCVFVAGDQQFPPEHLFDETDFSFLPMVVLQAVRVARPMGPDFITQMHWVGAECAADPERPLGFGVQIQPIGAGSDEGREDDLRVLRASTYRQAAEEAFGWLTEREVDLRAVFQKFMQGYEAERAALEAYTAHLHHSRLAPRPRALESMS